MEETALNGVKHGICVTVSTTGSPSKMEGTALVEFIPVIDESLITWINCTVEDVGRDAEKISLMLGFEQNLVSTLLSGFYGAYEDYGSSLGLMLPAVGVDKLVVYINPLLILIKKNLILTIHSERVRRLVRFSRYADIFMKKIPLGLPWTDRLTIVLARIIDENNERNFEGLRSIQDEGDEIARFLVDTTTPRTLLGGEIYKMKHALVTYLNVLWAGLGVVNSLRYGDAEVITDDEKLLEKFGLLAGDIQRQIQLSEHMSEVLASGLEVLQSIYNNQLQILNNRMAWLIAWLTVLGTAILVPNTLATILSNPAFAMNQLDVRWYVTALALSTIAATIGAYIWVKKSGWLPPRVD